MLYFLIHNNIHLIDAEEHLESLNGYETSLIKIPHRLTIKPSNLFNTVFEYPILFRRRRDYVNIKRIKSIHNKIQKDFTAVSSNDILIFYTEFELLSHHIIDLFKKKKATIIMIDEGFPTYQSLLNYHSELSIIDKILAYHLKYVLGYANTIITKLNNVLHFRLKDEMIDQVLLYNRVNVQRNLKCNLLKCKTYIYENIDEGKIVFLNEPFYDHFLNFDEYSVILKVILNNIADQFEMVYFKFHPRETLSRREKILLMIKELNRNITIITDDRPIELLINELQVKYLASFFAQTLLNHSHSNCTCLYLFHKFPEIMRDQIFENFKNILDSLNYNFFNDWSEIKSNKIGFSKANIAENSRLPLTMYI